MNIEPIWLLGQGVVIVSAGIWAHVDGIKRDKILSDMDSKLSERIARLETVLILMSEKAAKMLHGSHDPYGLDALVDKYINKNYDLTDAEWAELFEKCRKVQEDSHNPMDAKLAAILVETLARLGESLAKHKRMRSGTYVE